jgi:hypothetical protein
MDKMREGLRRKEKILERQYKRKKGRKKEWKQA